MNPTILKNFKDRPIIKALSNHILILDGAMGTQIQHYALDESAFKGVLLSDHPTALLGNNDILCLTQPDKIQAIHHTYLEAGADIITTNTFNATRLSQTDYGTADWVYKINYAGAKIAKEKALEWTAQTPEKPRFVAGSIGPTGKMGSLSPTINDPSYRTTTFDDFKNNYQEQIEGLIDGGADLLIIETITDILNVRAALVAANEAYELKGRSLPIMISGTLIDESGRLLSGHSLDAFVSSAISQHVISLGLNCSFGAKDLIPYIEALASSQSHFISVHPNAGMPDEHGHYNESPSTMADHLQHLINNQTINIMGGCCGTTPDHIRMLNTLVANIRPRLAKDTALSTNFAGTDCIHMKKDDILKIADINQSEFAEGFYEALEEDDFDSAIDELKDLLEEDFDLIQFNFDQLASDMGHLLPKFLRWIATEPAIVKHPLLITSASMDTLVSSLKAIQGKSLIHYLGQFDTSDAHLTYLQSIHQYGGVNLLPFSDDLFNLDTLESICLDASNTVIDLSGEDWSKATLAQVLSAIKEDYPSFKVLIASTVLDVDQTNDTQLVVIDPSNNGL